MTGRGQFPRQSQNVPQGTQLNNMFEIDQLVTAGGMGEVYKGHNIQTKDPVAIKIVLPEFAQDEFILELFRKEARILNHLHHEAIVRYYVFSIDAALGLPFLAMEYVDGPSLAERIKAGPLDSASIAMLQQHLADGLEKAHQAGVIHRDIAPDNIILPDGRVDRAKIIDFGIARSAAAGGGTLLGGQFAGKYNFVSPEQLGLYEGDVTNRSDIYSLGLVLAACALGRPLDMSGSQVAVIEKRRTVPDLSGIEPPLRGLIEAMLQPDPQDRPQSMAEVADWPTFEVPEPDDEKTRLYTSPPSRPSTRHPSRPPTRQHVHPPAAERSYAPAAQILSPQTLSPQPAPAPSPKAWEPPVWEPPSPQAWPPSPPPVAPPSRYDATPPAPPPAVTAREVSPPPAPPVQVPKPRPVERRGEKPKSKAGLVAGGIALAAILLAGVGGWAYVEFLSGEPYQDQSLNPLETETEPPSEATVDPDPPSEAAIEPEAPNQVATDPEPPAEGDEAGVTPPPADIRVTAAEIHDYVNGYDGGRCFYAFPADIGEASAEIIGYGNQRAPFDTLRDAFNGRFGFDPAIEMRNVTDDQCPVVEALGRFNPDGARQVGLDLSHGVLRSGKTLSGTISGVDGRKLSLLMLDNFGVVHNLNGYLKQYQGDATFEIREMSTANQMDFQPQLILSFASAEPLRSLDLKQSMPASEFISPLLKEIEANPAGLAAAVGYFKFGS